LEPLATERQFFSTLLEAKLESLDQALVDDFLLIDVMSGSEISKPALLGAVGSRQLKFEVVEVVESRVRLYLGTAMFNGRTQMRGRFGETLCSADRRDKHICVEQQDRWRMVAARARAGKLTVRNL